MDERYPSWVWAHQTTHIREEQIDRDQYQVNPQLDPLEHQFNELLRYYGFTARIDIRKDFNPVARAFPGGMAPEGFGAPKGTNYLRAMESLGLGDRITRNPVSSRDELRGIFEQLLISLGLKDERAA